MIMDVIQLKQVLGKSVYNRLEKRCQAEEILAAGIEGIHSIFVGRKNSYSLL